MSEVSCDERELGLGLGLGLGCTRTGAGGICCLHCLAPYTAPRITATRQTTPATTPPVVVNIGMSDCVSGGSGNRWVGGRVTCYGSDRGTPTSTSTSTGGSPTPASTARGGVDDNGGGCTESYTQITRRDERLLQG